MLTNGGIDMKYTEERLQQARERLSKFVRQQALNITRITCINYNVTKDAPDTYEGICKQFNNAFKTGFAVNIYSEASENSIYIAKHYNWDFRFWHDYLHYVNNLDLSVESEYKVGQLHVKAVSEEFGKNSLEYHLMYADTIKQTDYFKKTGGFVDNQELFARDHLDSI